MPFYMTLPNPSETQPLLCPHGPDLAPLWCWTPAIPLVLSRLCSGDHDTLSI